VVQGDESLATQTAMIWLLPSMTLHVSLKVVPRDESLCAWSTVKWILPSMPLHVSCKLVPGDKSLASRSTVNRDVRDVPINTLHVSLYVVLVEQSDMDSLQLTLHVSIQVVPEFNQLPHRALWYIISLA
jgi:hypothetical protein